MDLTSIPRLAPGCRIHPTQSVLLVPEGTLNLAGPACDILARLNGEQDVASIVAGLLQQYGDADAHQVESDVLSLLARLEQRGVVRVST